MAATPVATTKAENTSSVASITSNAHTTTTGNLLIALISRQNGASVSMTDLGGNTWHQAGADYQDGANPNIFSIYYAYNITGFTNNTVTASFVGSNSTYGAMTVFEFSNIGSSDPYIGSRANNAGASGTSFSTASITTGSDAVIVAMVENDAGATITAGTGYTGNVPATALYWITEYKVVTSSEAPTATGTSNAWRMVAAGFNAAPAVAAESTPGNLRRGLKPSAGGVSISEI